jgi:hypothetical protein
MLEGASQACLEAAVQPITRLRLTTFGVKSLDGELAGSLGQINAHLAALG